MSKLRRALPYTRLTDQASSVVYLLTLDLQSGEFFKEFSPVPLPACSEQESRGGSKKKNLTFWHMGSRLRRVMILPDLFR